MLLPPVGLPEGLLLLHLAHLSNIWKGNSPGRVLFALLFLLLSASLCYLGLLFDLLFALPCCLELLLVVVDLLVVLVLLLLIFLDFTLFLLELELSLLDSVLKVAIVSLKSRNFLPQLDEIWVFLGNKKLDLSLIFCFSGGNSLSSR